MDNNFGSDFFEGIGSVSQSTGSQLKKLPGDLIRTAKDQIAGPENPPEQNTPDPAAKYRESLNNKILSRAKNKLLVASDPQSASKRIAELRQMIASGNKQIISSQTERYGSRPSPSGVPSAVNRGMPPKIIPGASPLAPSQRQGQGSGELTRGSMG